MGGLKTWENLDCEASHNFICEYLWLVGWLLNIDAFDDTVLVGDIWLFICLCLIFTIVVIMMSFNSNNDSND